jgi:catechol 2,3-dioxygenase-like lactoylglutathione lyase family enzyme
MEIRGLDHLYVTVSDFARSERFYDPVMEALGFRKGDAPIAGEPHAHYFNPALQYTIRPARRHTSHDPYAPGLHHVCFQVDDPASVDEAFRRLRALGVEATEPRRYPEYNPDYYATFFSDPDGLRLEIVARTPRREEIARRWGELRVFLNPLAELRAREEDAREARWSVWRRDDHGNEFEVAKELSRDDAAARAAELEGRGHKQSYWIAPSARSSSKRARARSRSSSS